MKYESEDLKVEVVNVAEATEARDPIDDFLPAELSPKDIGKPIEPSGGVISMLVPAVIFGAKLLFSPVPQVTPTPKPIPIPTTFGSNIEQVIVHAKTTDRKEQSGGADRCKRLPETIVIDPGTDGGRKIVVQNCRAAIEDVKKDEEEPIGDNPSRSKNR